MTTAQETVAGQSRRRKWLPLESTLALASLAGLFGLPHRTWREALATAALLSLSIVLDFFVVREQRPDSKLSSELAFCEWGKICCVLAYIVFATFEGTRGHALLASRIALAFALIVTWAIVATIIAMMRPSRPHKRRRHFSSSADELRGDKVLALSGLLVAFLHITYFFAFALAFSDEFSGERDLWATRYYEALPSSDVSRGGETAGPTEKDACGYLDLKNVRKFFFVQSAATLTCTEDACAAVERDKGLQKTVCESDPKARLSVFAALTLKACTQPADSLERRAAAWNARQLYELRAHFRDMAAKPEPKGYLIEVRGHASDAPVRNDPAAAYASNYEISKQRADQVALLLSRTFREATAGLNEPAVRWLAYGVSNELSFLETDAKTWLDAEPLEKKLSVEVKVQEVAEPVIDRNLRTTSEAVASSSVPRELHLLDYLYFTVYTITTTGYGDIVPTSSYAKLLASLANLVELLFVVVLVNVVANTKAADDGGNERSKGDHDATRHA